MGVIELIQAMSGQADPIILGEPRSILRLGPSAIVRREQWTTATANDIAHLLLVVQQIAKSAWLQSPLSVSYQPIDGNGNNIKSLECPDDEATRAVLVLIRQLVASDESFTTACKAYCRHVADARKRWWIDERRDSFNKCRKGTPFGFPLGNRTVREIIDLMMYGARLIHRKPDDNRDGELAQVLQEFGKAQFVMAFHGSCRQICHYAFGVYHVLGQDLGHWITKEGCAPPDLINPAELLRGFKSEDVPQQ